jgi:hypothetical protein
MQTCKLFDRYRDKELSQEDRRQFEKHLTDCPDCQSKSCLIENLVLLLKQEEIATAPDLSWRIASRAFAPKRRWDSLVVSMLRPGPALATFTLALALFSFLWIALGRQTTTVSYSEYETLINEADSLNLDSSSSLTHASSDLMLWLEQERYSQ